MRIFLATFFIIVTYQITFSQNLQGLVIDQNSNVPVEFVDIQIDTLKTKTNKAGSFSLSAVPSGFYLLKVKREGFEVVNPKQLLINMGNSDFSNLKIEIVQTGTILRRSSQYYELAKNILSKRFQEKVALFTQESDTSDIVLNKLKEEKAQSLKLAKDIADKLACVNQNNMPPEYINSMKLCIQTDINAAIKNLPAANILHNSISENNETENLAFNNILLKARLSVFNLNFDTTNYYYEQLQKFNNTNFDFIMEFAWFCHQTNQYQKATELYTQAQNNALFDYQEAEYNFYAAMLEYDKKNIETALEKILTAIIIYDELIRNAPDIFEVTKARCQIFSAVVYKEMLDKSPLQEYKQNAREALISAVELLSSYPDLLEAKLEKRKAEDLLEFFKGTTVDQIVENKILTEAEALNRQAYKLLENGEDSTQAKALFNESVVKYNQLISNDKLNMQHQFDVTFSYQGLNMIETDNMKRIDNQRRIIAYRKAVCDVTNNASIREMLVVDYAIMAWYHILEGEYKKAVDFAELSSIISSRPTQAAAYKAMALVLDGDTRKGKAIYDEIRPQTFNTDSFKIEHLGDVELLIEKEISPTNAIKIPEMLYGFDAYCNKLVVDAQSLFQSAQNFEQISDTAKAIFDYQKSAEKYLILAEKTREKEHFYNTAIVLQEKNKLVKDKEVWTENQLQIIELMYKSNKASSGDLTFDENHLKSISALCTSYNFNNQSNKSYSVLKKAIGFYKNNAVLNKELAIHYLLTNKYNKARKLCSTYKHEIVGNKAFAEVILKDIDSLEKNGIENPNFEKIRLQLTNVELLLTDAKEYKTLGDEAAGVGDTKTAIAFYESSINTYEKLLKKERDIFYVFALSYVYDNLNSVETDILKRIENQKLIIELRTEVKKKFRKNKNIKSVLATSYGKMAWYKLLNKEFESAVKYATKGKSLDKSQMWISTYLAFAYLYSGYWRKAKDIFTENINKDSEKYPELCLKYIEFFESQGITNENVDNAKKLFNLLK